MGKLDVLDFLRKNDHKYWTIKEISRHIGITERNVRPSVIFLETHGYIYGKCRGNYNNWNREFKVV